MNKDIFSEEMLLLLNHMGGIPAWGRLSGRLSELKIDDLFLGFSDNSFMRSDVFVQGLPKLDSTVFELTIIDGKTSKKGIDNIDFMIFAAMVGKHFDSSIDEVKINPSNKP